jgi:hypothetical protein
MTTLRLDWVDMQSNMRLFVKYCKTNLNTAKGYIQIRVSRTQRWFAWYRNHGNPVVGAICMCSVVAMVFTLAVIMHGYGKLYLTY